ncbi:MAG: hypothetical protein ACRDDH_18270 [Cetobacterium sp.]|uniref:hypothetical protein n=1 Tax=Cetobacterium sp. TaxID=2071632 RepID=UPI003EE51240
MGHLTSENVKRVIELGDIQKVNDKLIRILERENNNYLAKGIDYMKDRLESKIKVLKDENKECQEKINHIYKHNEWR